MPFGNSYIKFAENEGLTAHARAVNIRFEEQG